MKEPKCLDLFRYWKVLSPEACYDSAVEAGERIARARGLDAADDSAMSELRDCVASARSRSDYRRALRGFLDRLDRHIETKNPNWRRPRGSGLLADYERGAQASIDAFGRTGRPGPRAEGSRARITDARPQSDLEFFERRAAESVRLA